LNYKIVFLKPASKELEESFAWYENKKPDLGLEFIGEIEYYLNLIKNKDSVDSFSFFNNLLD